MLVLLRRGTMPGRVWRLGQRLNEASVEDTGFCFCAPPALFGFYPKAGCMGLKSWVWVLGNARAAQGALKIKIRPGASFSVFGAASCENHDFGCPATSRGPCGAEKTHFDKLLAKIKNRMGFLHVARGPVDMRWALVAEEPHRSTILNHAS